MSIETRQTLIAMGFLGGVLILGIILSGCSTSKATLQAQIKAQTVEIEGLRAENAYFKKRESGMAKRLGECSALKTMFGSALQKQRNARTDK